MEEYTPSERYWILLLTFLGFLFDGYDLLIYSFTIVPIEKSFYSTDFTMGLVASLTLFSTLVGAIIFGWVSDRYGRKRGLMLTIATYGIATFISAFTQNIVQFSITRVVSGLGIGGEWGIGFSLLSEAWSKNRGLAGGILQSAFSVGMVLAVYVSSVFLVLYPQEGWRYVYITGGIPAVLVAIIRFYIPESKSWLESSRIRVKMERLKVFFKIETLRYLLSTLLLTSGFFFMAYAIITWWPKILITIYNISPNEFSAPLMVGSIIQVPVIFLVGYVSDRIGRKKTSILFALLTLISLITWLIFIHLYKINLGNIWTWPVMDGYIFYQAVSLYIGVFGIWFSEIFALKIKSTASNISYMAGRGIGGALSATMVVLLSPYLGGLQFSMLVLAIIGLIASMVAIFILPETKTSN
ncbi:MAG: MFS transporter [Euryarchaeota archaeon]|nr:MFS transporter [Thermoplasmata archaeon]MVT35576.1 MFS transporter [Euryarchaeota archaeon]